MARPVLPVVFWTACWWRGTVWPTVLGMLGKKRGCTAIDGDIIWHNGIWYRQQHNVWYDALCMIKGYDGVIIVVFLLFFLTFVYTYVRICIYIYIINISLYVYTYVVFIIQRILPRSKNMMGMWCNGIQCGTSSSFMVFNIWTQEWHNGEYTNVMSNVGIYTK